MKKLSGKFYKAANGHDTYGIDAAEPELFFPVATKIQEKPSIIKAKLMKRLPNFKKTASSDSSFIPLSALAAPIPGNTRADNKAILEARRSFGRLLKNHIGFSQSYSVLSISMCIQ